MTRLIPSCVTTKGGLAQKIFRTLAVFLLPAALAGEPAVSAGLEAEIRRIVEAERNAGGTPGMSVVVIRDGRVLSEYASGFANLETGLAATVDTLYPAASVSKILTAALVMQQVEAGRLDLDVPVNEYLEPAFRIRADWGKPVAATLRQLLSHNSGLPVRWNGIIDRGDPVPTMDEFLARGQRIIVPPGERVIYSNNGFALAGYVAARAAGRSFPEYARQALFEPLAMDRSSFESPWSLEDSLAAAYGHWFSGGSERSDHANLTATAPAGGLITTASDLARFALMILGEGELDGVRILRPESVAEMIRMQARVHPEMDQGFGLGFAIREQPGRRMVWWDGSSSGAAARLALLPEAKAGVVVLSNLADNEPASVAGRRILEIVQPAPAAADYQPSTEALDRAVGLYRPENLLDPAYWYLKYLLVIQVERRGDALVQESLITGERRLLPIGPNRFRMQGSIFDHSTILFDDDAMHMGHIRSRRISIWESPLAFAICAALLVLILASLAGRSAWRAIQRLRRPG